MGTIAFDSRLATGISAAQLREPEHVARVFAEAQRHSRRVRRLRKAIPIIATSALVLLVLAPYLNPFRGTGLSLGPVSLSGTRVTMDNPKLTGFRKDGKPYELVAKYATQDIRKPNEIELHEMTARLQMDAESWATLVSAAGQFDSQKEKMQLDGGVTLRTDSGYDVRLKNADIDFKAGTVRSRQPVKVLSGSTTIDAEALDVVDNGKIISFLGHVTALVENSDTQLGPSSTDRAASGKEPSP